MIDKKGSHVVAYAAVYEQWAIADEMFDFGQFAEIDDAITFMQFGPKEYYKPNRNLLLVEPKQNEQLVMQWTKQRLANPYLQAFYDRVYWRNIRNLSDNHIASLKRRISLAVSQLGEIVVCLSDSTLGIPPEILQIIAAYITRKQLFPTKTPRNSGLVLEGPKVK